MVDLAPRAIAQAPKFEVADDRGRIVRSFNGTRLHGLNRVAWDLAEDPPVPWYNTGKWNRGPSTGPAVSEVRLDAGSSAVGDLASNGSRRALQVTINDGDDPTGRTYTLRIAPPSATVAATKGEISTAELLRLHAKPASPRGRVAAFWTARSSGSLQR